VEHHPLVYTDVRSHACHIESHAGACLQPLDSNSEVFSYYMLTLHGIGFPHAEAEGVKGSQRHSVHKP
jgi:hypothetical protein